MGPPEGFGQSPEKARPSSQVHKLTVYVPSFAIRWAHSVAAMTGVVCDARRPSASASEIGLLFIMSTCATTTYSLANDLPFPLHLTYLADAVSTTTTSTTTFSLPSRLRQLAPRQRHGLPGAAGRRVRLARRRAALVARARRRRRTHSYCPPRGQPLVGHLHNHISTSTRQ